MSIKLQHVRVAFLLCGALLSGGGRAAPQSQGARDRGLSIQSDCGVLSVFPIAEGALRVRCAPASVTAAPSRVLIHQEDNVRFSIHRTADSQSLVTSRLTATFDLKTRALRFSDPKGRVVLEELPGGRSVRPSTVQGEPTLIAEDHFRSPAGEHLFGSGQFQDGFLDIRDVPRRLTQVNTQISIPFLFSNKGYGLLWHNYGLTDLNPTVSRLELKREAVGSTSTAAVTTTKGPATSGAPRRFSLGISQTHEAGRYAMMLDVGQAMARRYHVEIDGATMVDFANQWLPPTTSWFLDLKPGSHHVRVEGGTTDQPVVSWRSPRRRPCFARRCRTESTTWCSPGPPAMRLLGPTAGSAETRLCFRSGPTVSFSAGSATPRRTISSKTRGNSAPGNCPWT